MGMELQIALAYLAPFFVVLILFVLIVPLILATTRAMNALTRWLDRH